MLYFSLTFAVFLFYRKQYNLLTRDGNELNASDVSTTLQKIAFERAQVLDARNELLLTSDIMDISPKCKSCQKRKNCPDMEYRVEFKEIFISVETVIIDTLVQLEQFIQNDSKNYRNDFYIGKAKRLYDDNMTDAQRKSLDQIIQEFKARVIDNEDLLKQLNESLRKISEVYYEKKSKLIGLAKRYYYDRVDNLHNDCFTPRRKKPTIKDGE